MGGSSPEEYPYILCNQSFRFRTWVQALLYWARVQKKGIDCSFFTPRGRFLARVQGPARGNVLLRREQYRRADNREASVDIARNFITGKVFNGRWVLERALRDHALRIDVDSVRKASNALKETIAKVKGSCDLDSLRGFEGDAASAYFGVLNELILRDKEKFHFASRRRRPPTDPVNAMLSLFYTVLSSDCSSALERVGLDPCVGFMHADRPGRKSLALNLMEELRPAMVDRFVLTAINNRIISPASFELLESGEVRLKEKGRKELFTAWQSRKKEVILHPFLKEKVPWGLVPHVQALLLARCIRGDLEGYPPFLWK